MEEIFEQIGLTPALVMGFGFAIGIEHAFESDHISVVGTQISKLKTKHKSSKLIKESFTKSSILGGVWGIGHTTTLVLIGCLVYVFSINIQNHIFFGLEFAVGLMLVFFGILTIFNKKIKFYHKHPHKYRTIHLDEHTYSDHDHLHGHKSYIIGLVHGLAGSGSIVMLAAASLNDINIVLGFIIIFGMGSMVGMSLVGSLLGIPLMFGNKTTFIKKTFRYVAGTFSLVIGIDIMYRIGFLGNIF